VKFTTFPPPKFCPCVWSASSRLHPCSCFVVFSQYLSTVIVTNNTFTNDEHDNQRIIYIELYNKTKYIRYGGPSAVASRSARDFLAPRVRAFPPSAPPISRHPWPSNLTAVSNLSRPHTYPHPNASTPLVVGPMWRMRDIARRPRRRH